mmetsp:Transcript_8559/g.20776  ORF Transcript_8559/g.20776 Transcript_8559/m.20776 type:complete len:272 (+) Transcript_8559:873-1688(+)
MPRLLVPGRCCLRLFPFPLPHKQLTRSFPRGWRSLVALAAAFAAAPTAARGLSSKRPLRPGTLPAALPARAPAAEAPRRKGAAGRCHSHTASARPRHLDRCSPQRGARSDCSSSWMSGRRSGGADSRVRRTATGVAAGSSTQACRWSLRTKETPPSQWSLLRRWREKKRSPARQEVTMRAQLLRAAVDRTIGVRVPPTGRNGAAAGTGPPPCAEFAPRPPRGSSPRAVAISCQSPGKGARRATSPPSLSPRNSSGGRTRWNNSSGFAPKSE